MKKLFHIFLLCLLAMTATAQNTETRRLRVKVTPDKALAATVSYMTQITDEMGNVTTTETAGACSDTTDIDLQVPVGTEFTIYVNTVYSSSIEKYKLVGWTVNGSATTLRQRDEWSAYTYELVMPDKDIDIVGTFEYAPLPDTDQHPALGGWYPETGTYVKDYNDNGTNLSYDVRQQVLRFIVAGNYYGSEENDRCYFYDTEFPNCTSWDISRTNAKTAVCSSYNGYNKVTEAVLPASITHLKANAFLGTRLQTLVIYALTPPEFGSIEMNYETYQREWQTPFPDCPDMEVRVPAEALPLYQAAEHWKDYTIVAIDGTYANLTVQLFDQATAEKLAPYKNMSLVLTSKASGLTRRYVIGDKNDYEFRYLTTNTSYGVQVLNNRDVVIGELDNIYLGEDNKAVTLPLMRGVHTLHVALTAGGEDVAEGYYSNTWLRQDGSFVARGATLADMIDGEQLRYVVAIDASLAMTYQTPDTTDVTVGVQADNMVVALQPIPEKMVTFEVIDSVSKQGIADATILVSQLFAQGQRGTTVTLTTDKDGRATAQLLAVPSAITVRSPIHGSQSSAADLSTESLLTFKFLPANGTTIQLSHTWQAAVAPGVEPTVDKNYSDGRNLEYEFHAILPNQQDSLITHMLANYPIYTLYTDLPEGTKVQVRATSTTGTVEPVVGEATVGEEKAVIVTLPIVERGYIQTSYVRTESSKPAVMVFNRETGELVRRLEFSGAKSMSIKNLPTGNYVVAAMSQGTQYAGISSMAQLEMYTADTDYVTQEVTVSEGRIAEARFLRVPLTQTMLDTRLSARRAQWGASEVPVGFSAGINVTVAFKDLKERLINTNYDESLYPTDCKLEMYVPEGMTTPTAYRSQRMYYGYMPRVSGVTNSPYFAIGTLEAAKAYEGTIAKSEIQLTPATTQWDAQERKFTVEWPNYDEGGQVKLSMVPTLSNSYKPEIYLTYTLGGKQYREILETNTLTVSRSGIKVPERIVKPTFKVSGTAMYYEEEGGESPKAIGRRAAAAASAGRAWFDMEKYKYYEVAVMDGDDQIGKAQINSNGEWSAQCALIKATGYSKHNIWAKITYKNGVSYQTESKQVTYDPNGVVPYSVTMSFFNHHPQHLVNQQVYFDLVNQTASPRSYGYSNEEGYNTDFTFEINLSNNSPEKVYAVDLAIFTEGPDAESFIIPAHYNARKNRWIAYEKFNTRSLPNNVNVRAYYHADPMAAASELKEIYDFYASWFEKDQKAERIANDMQVYIDQINQAIAASDASLMPDAEEVIALLDEMCGGSSSGEGATEMSTEEAEAFMNQLATTVQEMQEWDDVFGNGVKDLNTLGTALEGFTFSKADGMTPESLQADGFEELKLDDGGKFYIKVGEDNAFTFVDLNRNLVMSCDGSKFNAARGMRRTTITDILAEILQKIDDLRGALDKVNTWTTAMYDAITIMISKNQSALYTAKDILSRDLRMNSHFFSNASSASIVRNAGNIVQLNKEIGILEMAKKAVGEFKFGQKLGSLSSIWGLVSDAIKGYDDIAKLVKIRNALPNPCPDDQASRDALAADLLTTIITVGAFQATVIANDALAVVTAFASVIGISTGALAPPGLLGVALSLTQFGLSYLANKIYESRTENMANEFAYRKSKLKCNKKKNKESEKKKNCTSNCDDGGGGGDGDGDGDGGGGGGGMDGGTSGTTGTLDPSGFVYEGVENNRLEGVTATVFYKETKKNEFGDDVEKVYVWDAENYGQVNPQVTDENGEYGWMVPTGLWQVKYEKQGYQTEYSEWLPVPPPQLDVNQGMMQMSVPQVSSVKATAQQVQISFDKYMMADSLTAKTVFVTKDGQQVDGTIDAMVVGADNLQRLTDKVRFIPATPLTAGESLLLTVKGNVTSYAGVEMGSDFQQAFDIIEVVETLQADSAVHVIYDQATAVTIQALPATAAVGKKASVKVLSDLVASADKQEVEFDAQGKAVVTLTGEAHGTTAAVVQMTDDADVKTTIVVDVKDDEDFVCPMPTANYLPDQSYDIGTQVVLTCELPEAVIYYTLDGTCPCDEGSASVKQYTEPIALTGNVLIKAFAKAPGYADSDITELQYLVNGIVNIPVKQQLPKATYTLSGQKVEQGSRLMKGIYIQNGRKVVIK